MRERASERARKSLTVTALCFNARHNASCLLLLLLSANHWGSSPDVEMGRWKPGRVILWLRDAVLIEGFFLSLAPPLLLQLLTEILYLGESPLIKIPALNGFVIEIPRLKESLLAELNVNAAKLFNQMAFVCFRRSNGRKLICYTWVNISFCQRGTSC